MSTGRSAFFSSAASMAARAEASASRCTCGLAVTGFARSVWRARAGITPRPAAALGPTRRPGLPEVLDALLFVLGAGLFFTCCNRSKARRSAQSKSQDPEFGAFASRPPLRPLRRAFAPAGFEIVDQSAEVVVAQGGQPFLHHMCGAIEPGLLFLAFVDRPAGRSDLGMATGTQPALGVARQTARGPERRFQQRATQDLATLAKRRHQFAL